MTGQPEKQNKGERETRIREYFRQIESNNI